LSRGAAFATFVESDRRALEALSRNVDALRERERSRILPYAVTRAVALLPGDSATLVICDPPYAEVTSGSVAKLLDEVVTRGVVGEDATVVLEHATRDASALAAIPSLQQQDQRSYGDTTLTFFRVYTRRR
jgi:16S rRNA (guanine966-N2)-methyltransferase